MRLCVLFRPQSRRGSVNVLSVNLAAFLKLWYAGYRPDHWFESDAARRATLRRVCTLVAGIVVLSAALGSVTGDSYQRATTDTAVDEAATEVVAEAGVSLELIETTVECPGPVPV